MRESHRYGLLSVLWTLDKLSVMGSQCTRVFPSVTARAQRASSSVHLMFTLCFSKQPLAEHLVKVRCIPSMPACFAGNWRAALQDSERVLILQPDNLKAIFRGARAAGKLKEWGKCSRLVEVGMKLEPGAPELLQIQKVSGRGLGECWGGQGNL